VNELDPDKEVIVHCKLGGRSAKAVEFLHKSGFTKAKNLTGGIAAWSEKIDPKVPKY
jgi:adenylyltransferase/sulfurtransferase